MNGIFNLAFERFLKREEAYLSDDASERNLCCRLAIYLEGAKAQAGLTDYFADTEYNRKQNGLVKTIINGEGKIVSIVCDLILHSRGHCVRRDNLIAIEMKKSHRPNAEKELDRERLIAMTKKPYKGVWSANGEVHPEHVCGYELGVFIDLDVWGRRYSLEKYKRGKRVSIKDGNY